eukprot:4977265-Pyramimonas_sp.AAC.1
MSPQVQRIRLGLVTPRSDDVSCGARVLPPVGLGNVSFNAEDVRALALRLMAPIGLDTFLSQHVYDLLEHAYDPPKKHVYDPLKKHVYDPPKHGRPKGSDTTALTAGGSWPFEVEAASAANTVMAKDM